jgi:hypothetical protein
LTTKLQLVEQPSEPERVAAENLKPGQFLAAGALTTGRPTEVLFTDTYPQRLGRETLIVHRPLGVDYSIASIVGGNHWFAVAAEADLAAMHKQAEREQLANELRRLAEMILNPAMPVPQYGISMYASFKTGAEVRAAAEVFSLPVESRKPNAGIQTPEWPQDRKSYEQGIHLHWLTITDESGEACAPVDDPTGLAYTRADDEADDPTPIGPREPMHTGAMTESGLVDETPEWRPGTGFFEPGRVPGLIGEDRPRSRTGEIDPDSSMEAHCDAEADRLPRCPNCHGRHDVADGCH